MKLKKLLVLFIFSLVLQILAKITIFLTVFMIAILIFRPSTNKLILFSITLLIIHTILYLCGYNTLDKELGLLIYVSLFISLLK